MDDFEGFGDDSEEYGRKLQSLFSDIDLILPNLFLGNRSAAHDKNILKFHGITHIVQCTEGGHPFQEEFTYMKIEAGDSEDFQMCEHFASSFEFIEQALSNENNAVFVHCAAGASRSATIVIAYIMKKLSLPYTAALKYVQNKRPIVQPNEGFLQQLQQYEKQLENMYASINVIK
jgi:dual specificity phosphatase 12